MLKRLDRSKSFQAPWVRRSDDFLHGAALPSCLPWGTHARRHAGTFRRAK